MDVVKIFIDVFLHLDKTLGSVIQTYGVWTYVILFVIVFCETGLVVTPFLPGDSLLFAAGAFAALGNLHFLWLWLLLLVAAILGDMANYYAGRTIGMKIDGWLRSDHLRKTERFYAKYGAKTIVFARFVPIVRTVAPFVAGIGTMPYHTFFLYNVVGAIAWVTLCLGSGYLFGNIPVVREHFTIVILGIIVVSFLPAIFEAWKEHRNRQSAA